MDSLRDNIWQFVGVVVAIVGLFFNALAFPDIATRLIGIIVVLFLALGIMFLSKTIKPQQGKTQKSIKPINPPLKLSNSMGLSTPIVDIHCPPTMSQQMQMQLIEEGNQRYLQEDDRGAKEAYERASILNPDNPLPYYYLGNVYYRRNHYAEALRYYQQAIQHDSFDACAYYRKGMTLESLGRSVEAKQAYKQALVHHSNIASMDHSRLDDINFEFVKLYYRVKSMVGWAILIGILILGLIANLNPTKAHQTSTIFQDVTIAEIIFFLLVWIFIWISRKILHIVIPPTQNTNKSGIT